MADRDNYELLYTNRAEIDEPLEIIQGHLPGDIHGVFYACYPAGSVNSGGLPFSETTDAGAANPEYGSPIMNGDGMVIKIDLNHPGQPTIKSRLMKTPCYWADLATREGTSLHHKYGFKNFGISRMSLELGARNELNTAVTPVMFKGQKHPSLVAAYDVGRPYLLDADSLQLVSPIGTNAVWKQSTPEILHWPFQMVQGTAHPVFDAETKELFGVNFTRNTSALIGHPKIFDALKNDASQFEHLLHNELQTIKAHPVHGERLGKLHSFLENIHIHLANSHASEGQAPASEKKRKGFLARVWAYLKKVFGIVAEDVENLVQKVEAEVSTKNDVYLVRWSGGGDPERWVLHDAAGKPIVIDECLHQMSFTRDYIIITDCSFKFSIDLLVSNPFPGNYKIDDDIRALLAKPMDPVTATYIVKRKELTPGGGKATAYALDKPIPLETIHYSCNYENPNGQITLLGMHNTAVCIAEWIRPYDKNQLTGQLVDRDLVSLFAIGSMDVSRVGKWVIDGEKATLLTDASSQYWNKGNPDDPAGQWGPHTWSIVLYTFRDIISPVANVASIKNVYFISDGVDNRSLTEFIYKLYKDYPNRVVPLDEVEKITKLGVPYTLVQLDATTMTPVKWLQLPANTYLRSLHFISKKTATPNIDPDTDGYIFCTVQAGVLQQDGRIKYTSEYWIFDATDITKGTICRLASPGLQFCFTLHSAWLPQALPNDLDYKIDAASDYNPLIKDIWDPITRQEIQALFDQNIYPNL